jgi:hypothetical protein
VVVMGEMGGNLGRNFEDGKFRGLGAHQTREHPEWLYRTRGGVKPDPNSNLANPWQSD